ncbi:MAG: hypothetical protein NTW50_05245 [Candidatus Berkelbacteria bacterium]|nr:hypothetical protein [Candidatus Berkelbacteria bacterium]
MPDHCQKISQKIQGLEKKVKFFNSIFGEVNSTDKVRRLFDKKSEINQDVAEIEGEFIYLGRQFIKVLEDDETWGEIMKVCDEIESVMLKKMTSDDVELLYRDKIREILNGKDFVPGKLTTRAYKDFASRLESGRVSRLIWESLLGQSPFVDMGEKLISIFHTLFIEKYIEKGKSLFADTKAPAYFGIGLNAKENIIFNESDFAFGYKLNGGSIEAIGAGPDTGYAAIKGRIKIYDLELLSDNQSERAIGTMAESKVVFEIGTARSNIEISDSGATFYIRYTDANVKILGLRGKTPTLYIKSLRLNKVGESLLTAHSSNIRTDTGAMAQILLGEYGPNTIMGGEWRNIYFYDESVGRYFELSSPRASQARFVTSEREFRKHLEKKMPRLVMIASNDGLLANPTYQMDHGIRVSKIMPKSLIGEGMTGGILILEVPGLTQEDARARLCPEREGGLIFIRERDPDNPKKTKLLEVKYNSEQVKK